MAYGNDADFLIYVAAKGYALGSLTETERDVLRERASVYVDQLGLYMTKSGVPVSRYPGKPTGGAAQIEAWPRLDAADVYGNDIASDTVPVRIEQATYEAAVYENANPGALNTALNAGDRVTREKFGEVEFQYAEGSTMGTGLSPTTPGIPAVMTILSPLLGGGANPYGITAVVA